MIWNRRLCLKICLYVNGIEDSIIQYFWNVTPFSRKNKWNEKQCDLSGRKMRSSAKTRIQRRLSAAANSPSAEHVPSPSLYHGAISRVAQGIPAVG